MTLYYFPIAQNTVNKTVSEKKSAVYMLLFSIYWSDTSLEYALFAR